MLLNSSMQYAIFLLAFILVPWNLSFESLLSLPNMRFQTVVSQNGAHVYDIQASYSGSFMLVSAWEFDDEDEEWDDEEELMNLGSTKKKSSMPSVPVDGAQVGTDARSVATQWTKKAVELRDLGLLKPGRAALKKAIEADPEWSQSFFNYGVFSVMLGEQDAALDFYRQAVKMDPTFCQAVLALSSMLSSMGALKEQGTMLKKSMKLKVPCARVYMNYANLMRKQGKLDLAIKYHREGLKHDPNDYLIFFNLGNAYFQAEKWSESLSTYNKVLQWFEVYVPQTQAQKTILAGALTNIGACVEQFYGDEAVAADYYKRAYALDDRSQDPDTVKRMAMSFEDEDEKLQYLKTQIKVFPEDKELLLMYVSIMEGQGKAKDVPAIQFTTLLDSKVKLKEELLLSLCRIYLEQRNRDECMRCLLHAKSSYPNSITVLESFVEMALNMQMADQVTFDHIVESLFTIAETSTDPHQVAGTLFKFELIERVGDCLAVGKQWTDQHLHPVGDEGHVYAGYAKCVSYRGDMLAARPLIQKAINAVRDDPDAYISYLSLLPINYMRDPDTSGQQVATKVTGLMEEICSLVYEDTREPGERWWVNRLTKGRAMRDTTQPLRIGYITGDMLLYHPVMCLMEGILTSHDPRKVTVHMYHDNNDADEDDSNPSWRIKQTFKQNELKGWKWLGIHGYSHEEVQHLILQDRIDVLIDLSGFFNGGGNVAKLCRRLAPVQAVYMGFPFTTGHPHYDYYIADHQIVPEHREHLFTEHVKKFPQPYGYFSFKLLPHTPEVAARAPVMENGYVTFGSYNDIAKISPLYISLVSRVMLQVPTSRLILRNKGMKDPAVYEHYTAQFESHGITADRISFRGVVAPVDPTGGANATADQGFLKKYHDIDIVLDPTPYTGHMSSVQALIMGVPIVTLAQVDKPVVGMGTVAFLSVLGSDYHELITDSQDAYVAKAIELAQDPDKIQWFREHLRQDWVNGPLGDYVGHTRAFETLMYEMHAEREMELSKLSDFGASLDFHESGVPEQEASIPMEIVMNTGSTDESEFEKHRLGGGGRMRTPIRVSGDDGQKQAKKKKKKKKKMTQKDAGENLYKYASEWAPAVPVLPDTEIEIDGEIYPLQHLDFLDLYAENERFVVTSFWTADYSKKALKLLKSCIKFQIPYHFQLLDEDKALRGLHSAVTGEPFLQGDQTKSNGHIYTLKPRFMFQALSLHKVPTIWIDAKLHFKQFPNVFRGMKNSQRLNGSDKKQNSKKQTDFWLINNNVWNEDLGMTKPFGGAWDQHTVWVSSGIMGFRYTPQVLDLLAHWSRAMQYNQNKYSADDQVFDDVFNHGQWWKRLDGRSVWLEHGYLVLHESQLHDPHSLGQDGAVVYYPYKSVSQKEHQQLPRYPPDSWFDYEY